MTPLEILQVSRSLINHPSKWVIKQLEDDFGRRCSLGAIRHVATRDPITAQVQWFGGQVLAATDYLAEGMGLSHLAQVDRLEAIADWNDSHTHEQVMAAWDRAIELAKADEEIQGISVADLIDELAPA